MSRGDQRKPAEAGAIIFHTADLHSRLRPGAARRLKELKDSHPGCLLLDAGDAVAAGNLTFRPGGEPILRTMTEIGYDAMAMGNRESHPRRWFLERKVRDAGFPILCANLRPQQDSLPEFVKPYLVLASGGMKVAVIGLSPQMVRPGSRCAKLADFLFADPVETAAALVPDLTRAADAVVILSHCGLQTDEKLARIPGVRLVLGGHSHVALTTQYEQRVSLAHSGAYGRYVSMSELAPRTRARVKLIALEPER